MRRRLTEKLGDRATKSMNIHMSQDLLELIDLSAERNNLTRSAEMNRLIRVGLGKAPPKPSESREVRGQIV